MPPVARRKVSVLCVLILNVFLCVLFGVSWKLRKSRSERREITIPSRRFWQRHAPSPSFWNRQQQRLDFIHNPNFKSEGSPIELPDWLNDTGPADQCQPDHGVRTQVSDYNLLPRTFQDFLLHMRCRTHPLLIEPPDLCGAEPFLLLAVKSSIPNFDRRQAIRQTWGRAGVLRNRTIATVFLLGNSLPSDHLPDLRGMLGHEAALHGDLLQWDFRDSFFNLTLKDVLFLEWFGRSCADARYVLKGDDDVLVNTLRILEVLDGLTERRAADLFMGDVIRNAGPHRDSKLKYFVPESVYVGPYPPYAGGGGYLLSGGLALRLRNVSRLVALYPIDDVYTGMCLRKLGLAPEKHGGFRTFDIDQRFRGVPCVYRSLLLVHSRTPQEMLALWPWITHPEWNCQ